MTVRDTLGDYSRHNCFPGILLNVVELLLGRPCISFRETALRQEYSSGTAPFQIRLVPPAYWWTFWTALYVLLVAFSCSSLHCLCWLTWQYTVDLRAKSFKTMNLTCCATLRPVWSNLTLEEREEDWIIPSKFGAPISIHVSATRKRNPTILFSYFSAYSLDAVSSILHVAQKSSVSAFWEGHRHAFPPVSLYTAGTKLSVHQEDGT